VRLDFFTVLGPCRSWCELSHVSLDQTQPVGATVTTPHHPHATQGTRNDAQGEVEGEDESFPEVAEERAKLLLQEDLPPAHRRLPTVSVRNQRLGPPINV
jgi:hypothetical protein